jgi:hypothetical protein
MSPTRPVLFSSSIMRIRSLSRYHPKHEIMMHLIDFFEQRILIAADVFSIVCHRYISASASRDPAYKMRALVLKPQLVHRLKMESR